MSRTPAEFGAHRDTDLLNNFQRLLGLAPAGSTVDDIFPELVRQPAERFYVSEFRACRVISHWMRAGYAPSGFRRTRLRMYGEIKERVEAMMSRSPGMRLSEAVSRVVNSPAPEFYMEPGSARVTLYALLRRRRNRRRLAAIGEGGRHQ